MLFLFISWQRILSEYHAKIVDHVKSPQYTGYQSNEDVIQALVLWDKNLIVDLVPREVMRLHIKEEKKPEFLSMWEA